MPCLYCCLFVTWPEGSTLHLSSFCWISLMFLYSQFIILGDKTNLLETTQMYWTLKNLPQPHSCTWTFSDRLISYSYTFTNEEGKVDRTSCEKLEGQQWRYVHVKPSRNGDLLASYTFKQEKPDTKWILDSNTNVHAINQPSETPRFIPELAC